MIGKQAKIVVTDELDIGVEYVDHEENEKEPEKGIVLSETHRLINDDSCYTLQERKITQTGKNKGEGRWENVSFHRNILGGVKAYREIARKKASQACTAEKLDEAISKLELQDKIFIKTITTTISKLVERQAH